jgi:D-alanyl-D-alanine carboxypeptidase-like protein
VTLTVRGKRAVAALVGTAAVAAVAAFLLSRGPHIVIPDDPCGDPPPLQTYRGVTLQPLAMQAFRKAEALAGRQIPVVQSYRSCARQARACERICSNPKGCPGLCASPGSSYHQLGAAIDVSAETLEDRRIVDALLDAGWCQSVPVNDPGHFSFDGCH